MERREAKISGEVAGVPIPIRAPQEREDERGPGQEHRGGSSEVFVISPVQTNLGDGAGTGRAGQRDGESPSCASRGSGARGVEDPGDRPVAQQVWGLVWSRGCP